jgi:hypothetical protein
MLKIYPTEMGVVVPHGADFLLYFFRSPQFIGSERIVFFNGGVTNGS